MGFEELVDEAEKMLARRGRLSYALLRRHFSLDEGALADLAVELIEGRQVAADEGGVVLTLRGTPGGVNQVERRQLTVLFCDLVDATRLSSNLDPEDYGELLYRYQAMCADIVRRFDCRLAQMLGDGILVYAGYPHAHEDSAERAVRIGLGIVRQLPDLNAELAATDRRLAVRIGIHTGVVVVGAIDRGLRREELALGQAPNVAARIQSLAAPDTIVVSAATLHLLGGRFDSESLGRHLLKGVAEPVSAYRIRGELDTVRARSGGAPVAPLVGRAPELGRLRSALSSAVGGTGAALLIIGEAGIGKSRLVEDLCSEAMAVLRSPFECKGSPHHQDTPLYVVTSAVERLLGWSERDAPAARLARLEAALAECAVDVEATLPLFAPLLFLPLSDSRFEQSTLSPQRQREQVLETLVAITRAQARSRPQLIIIEDLQWLDPTSLELLERLVAAARDLPLLLLMTCRADFPAAWPAPPACTEIHLERLEPAAMSLLVEQIPGASALSAEGVRQIVERADGVPLFAEEITKTVIEFGASAAAIPSSLHDSLMARLDRLDSAKSVALEAAVIGREFELSLLEAVSAIDPVTLARELARLVGCELLYPVTSAQNATYGFRHVLVRDLAYASILKRSRREIHARIAVCLEAGFAGVREEQPEVLARHFFEGGSGAQAAMYWRRAGASADARSAYVEAARHFARALEALATLPESAARHTEEAALLLDLGRARAVISGWGAVEVEELFRRALDLSRATGERRLAFIALSGLRTHSLLRGNIRGGQQLAEELLGVALEARQPADIVVARGLLGDSLYRLGEIDLAVSQLERGRSIAPTWIVEPSYAGEDPRVHGLSHLALALWMQGRTARGLATIKEALERARALKNPLSMAYALRFSADLHQRCRALDEVRTQTDELRALATEQGFAHHAAIALLLRGWADAMMGDGGAVGDAAVQPGIDDMRSGLEAYRATGAIVNLPFFFGILAEVCARAGHLDEGLALTRAALALSRETRECWWDAEILRTRGALLERAPRDARTVAGDDADTCYREALAVARKQGARALELRAAVALGSFLADSGSGLQMVAPLAALLDTFTDGYVSTDMRAAGALLARLAKTD